MISKEILWKVCKRVLASSKEGIDIHSISKTERIAREILDEIIKMLSDLGFIKVIEEKVIPLAKLKLALYCLSHGLPVDKVALHLHWRDFEELVAEYLRVHNYIVYRNLRISPPKGVEVDVIGQKHDLGLIVDCKHWSPGYSKISKLREAAKEHHDRTSILAKKLWILARKYEKLREIRRLVPIIVTLTDIGLRYYQGVLISPIALFNDLLLNIDAVIDEYKCIIHVECWP